MSNLVYLYNPEIYKNNIKTSIKRIELTGTLIDFMSDEDIKKVKETKEYNLEKFQPFKEDIMEHFKFIQKLFNRLIKEFPEDDFLQSLTKEENQEIKYFTNWYIEYE